MAYATRADYVSRFGADELLQLTDRNRDDVEDAGVLDQAFADAGAEIDSYLQSRYALPLPTVPAALVRICCDITRYRLFNDRAIDEVRNRYTDAVKYLTSIANGVVQLGLAAPAAASVQADLPIVSSVDRVFSADSLSDY